MGRFWKRSETAELEARLRDERPRPSEELVDRLAADVPAARARPSGPRVRRGFAVAVTGAALAVAAVSGGIASTNKSSKPAAKPAHDQYAEQVTICHRSRKGEQGKTLTLPRDAAEAHLRQHPYDTRGPCPGSDPNGNGKGGNNGNGKPVPTGSSSGKGKGSG
jgi:hypothetical protein